MKACPECKGRMEELVTKTPENVPYTYYKCKVCGQEIVTGKQLHDVAEHYRTLKTYHAKLTQWGANLGVRIPKDLTEQYKLKPEDKIVLIPEKQGIRLVLKKN